MNIKLEFKNLLGLRLTDSENSTVVTSSKVGAKSLDMAAIDSKVGAKVGAKNG